MNGSKLGCGVSCTGCQGCPHSVPFDSSLADDGFQDVCIAGSSLSLCQCRPRLQDIGSQQSHTPCDYAMQACCHTCCAVLWNSMQADTSSQQAAGKGVHGVLAFDVSTPERSAPQTLLARPPGQQKHYFSMKSARAHPPLASQLQPVVHISLPPSLWSVLTNLSESQAMPVPCCLHRGQS